MSVVSPVPSDLPRHVYLKTRKQSFTHEWYFALRDEQIWMKANEETTGRREEWRPLGKACPGKIEEISADGDTLVVLTDDRRAHYLDLSKLPWGGRFKSRWDYPVVRWFRKRPLEIPAGRPWVATRRKIPYADINGTLHHSTWGCSNLYVLAPDGTKIGYGDEWLPPPPNLPGIGGPERGKFVMNNLAASASTLLAIGEGGELYTRLADCDSIGDNCFLTYSHDRERRPDTRFVFEPRGLPAEDWKLQPRIAALGADPPGRITGSVTMVQTPPGNGTNPNHARELRVQGIDGQERKGYYYKALTGETWSFRETGEEMHGPFLDTSRPSPRGPSRDRRFAGSLKVRGHDIGVRVLDFGTHNTSARVELEVDGQTFPLTLESYAYRRRDRRKPATLLGALQAGPEIAQSNHPAVQAFYEKVMRGQLVRQVSLELGDTLSLRGRLGPLSLGGSFLKLDPQRDPPSS